MTGLVQAVAPARFRRLAGIRARHCLAAAIAGLGLLSLSSGIWIKAKAGLAQILLQSAWERTLDGEAQVRPWPWADVWPAAKLEFPRLERTAIALSGTSGEALAFGPGLMHGTAQPGEPGLAVIAAHRDTHFRLLKDVKVGDTVFLTREDGAALSFEIVQTRIVNAAASGLVNEGVSARIALVTCYPFEAGQRGPLRYVAIGELRP